MGKFKLEAISFVQTFVTLFLVDIAFALSQTSPEILLKPELWSSAAVIGVLSAVARSALKAAWQKTMPKSVGGLPKK